MKKTQLVKTKQNNIKTIDESKIERRPYEDYYCTYSFKRKPISEAYIDSLCLRQKKFADYDGDSEGKGASLRHEDFLDSEGISPQDYYRFKAKFIQLQASHEYCLRRLASRREIGSLTRRYDSGSVFKTLAHYCPIYSEQQQITAKLRDQEAEARQIIVIESFPQEDNKQTTGI